jgi:hypothetical protein
MLDLARPIIACAIRASSRSKSMKPSDASIAPIDTIAMSARNCWMKASASGPTAAAMSARNSPPAKRTRWPRRPTSGRAISMELVTIVRSRRLTSAAAT